MLDPRVASVLLHIDQTIPHVPSIEKMANAVGVSMSHLQHLFKRELGLSIKQHVKRIRIKLACELLKGSNLSIKEVCVCIRFPDRSHFFSEFKREIGITPRQFRFQQFSQQNSSFGNQKLIEL